MQTPTLGVGEFTLALLTQTGKNRCARVTVPSVAGRACLDSISRMVKYSAVGGRTLTRFASAWV